jgi:hypothetical protein
MTTAKVRVRGVFWRDSLKGTQAHPETKARGDWYIRYTDHHGKLHERVGPRNLAIELYRKRKTEVREGRFFPETAKKPVVLFNEIAEDFLAYSREHKKSAEHDEARMSRLKEMFGDRPVGEISTQDVEQLRAALGKNLSAASVNRHLALLKVAFNRAMRAEPPKAERNPVRGVKLLKENNSESECSRTHRRADCSPRCRTIYTRSSWQPSTRGCGGESSPTSAGKTWTSIPGRW